MKRVLVYFPQHIAPIIMANQQRIYDKIVHLAKDYLVTFISIVNNQEEEQKARILLQDICELHFIHRPGKKSLYGKLLRFAWAFSDYAGFRPFDYLGANGKWVTNDLDKFFKTSGKFDVVICDYWFGGVILDYCKDSLKIIDTHNVLGEKRELELLEFEKKLNNNKWLAMYKYLEEKYLSKADILLAISTIDYNYYVKEYGDKQIYLLPIGINLKKLDQYKLEPEDNTILFYGNLASDQNINALERLWENIIPVVKKKIPDLKLLILGSNPVEKIVNMGKLEFVTVTGYVEDPFEYIRKAKILILPLMTGGGFRGRIVETMGMGLPSIGTHNAFDCIEMTDGVNGFITDDDSLMADTAIRLLTDDNYWADISNNTKEFIQATYSFETTYCKLSTIIAAN